VQRWRAHNSIRRTVSMDRSVVDVGNLATHDRVRPMHGQYRSSSVQPASSPHQRPPSSPSAGTHLCEFVAYPSMIDEATISSSTVCTSGKTASCIRDSACLTVQRCIIGGKNGSH
jgi:hypothetical protein